MAEIVTDDRQRPEQETIQELRITIRSNEEIIKKSMEDGEDEANKNKIKALEDENKAQKKKIDEQEKEKESWVKQLQKMYEITEEIVEDKKDNKEREDNEKSVFIIVEIGRATQRNLCEYVLGKHFRENFHFYKVEDLEKQYIAKWINNKAEQDLARKRWSELKGKKIWNESLVEGLENLIKRRHYNAHPKLTSENIQKAMEWLKEDLDEKVLDNIRKLKKNWETSESLLGKRKPETANEKQVGGSRKRKQLQKALSCKRQRLLGSQDGQSMNEEKLRKMEQELQEKEKEIEELKREKENAQHELQQQAQESKILTTRIKEFKEEFESLVNVKIKKLKQELKNQMEESEKLKVVLEEIKGNQHRLFLAEMCDQLQKNFYQIVFYPHDFRKEIQSYKERYIERDIEEGFYGLTTKQKKRQARKRWSDLQKNLGWESQRHVRAIKQLKDDSRCTAHPKITKDMKESLEDGAKALNHERNLDEPTLGIVQNLIDMWFKTEDHVQRMKISV